MICEPLHSKSESKPSVNYPSNHLMALATTFLLSWPWYRSPYSCGQTSSPSLADRRQIWSPPRSSSSSSSACARGPSWLFQIAPSSSRLSLELEVGSSAAGKKSCQNHRTVYLRLGGPCGHLARYNSAVSTASSSELPGSPLAFSKSGQWLQALALYLCFSNLEQRHSINGSSITYSS